MIPIRRPDLADANWLAWRQKTAQAKNTLVTGYHPWDDVNLQEDLYKEAMPFLLELFHGKCAYCETVITSSQPGDVEHYRPKGRIRDEQGRILKVRINGDEIEHPGYWWLAYDWHNLLPACIDCNRRRRHEDAGSAGKGEFFEVRGRRAVMPEDDLAQEQPLLLDPSVGDFDPAQHFEFKEDGTIKPVTDEARYSCELLGLNLREKLVGQRGLMYLQAQQALAFLLSQSLSATPEQLTLVRQQINDMWEGRSAYSAFARQALDAARVRVQQNIGVRVDLPLSI
jgi:uncharacterized protein (TIGR02646 family)